MEQEVEPHEKKINRRQPWFRQNSKRTQRHTRCLRNETGVYNDNQFRRHKQQGGVSSDFCGSSWTLQSSSILHQCSKHARSSPLAASVKQSQASLASRGRQTITGDSKLQQFHASVDITQEDEGRQETRSSAQGGRTTRGCGGDLLSAPVLFFPRAAWPACSSSGILLLPRWTPCRPLEAEVQEGDPQEEERRGEKAELQTRKDSTGTQTITQSARECGPQQAKGP
jgi:hypothetical protein